MIGIYKITSPTKRIYIGQSINIEKRFNHYRKMYNCKSQVRLYRSFKKHSVSSHLFEVIEECEIEKLNDKERYYQDFYNVTGLNGLNCSLTKGNNKEGKNSKQSAKKIKKTAAKKGIFKGELNPFWGKKHSEETKKILREKNSGENHPFWGKKRPEHSLKISGNNHYCFGKKMEWLSDMNKKRVGLLNPRSIILLDINSGVYYYSLMDYCNVNNINVSTLKYKLKNNKINNLIEV